ncbi:virion protein [Cetacean poxvirus 1]|nr:virion protein [Cetacean poxvirus 1]
MFFANDNSFFKYLSEQEDEIAMSDLETISCYLDFMLTMLIKSKDKLEVVGYCYDPLSEDFRSLVKFIDMNDLRKVYDKALTNVNDDVNIKLYKGYLTDFIISLMRLKTESKLEDIPNHTRYIDPRRSICFSNMLSILHQKQNR